MEQLKKVLNFMYSNVVILAFALIIMAQAVPSPDGERKHKNKNEDWTTISYGKMYAGKNNQVLIGFPLVNRDSTLSKEIVYNMFLSKDTEYRYFKVVGIEKEEYEKAVNQFK